MLNEKTLKQTKSYIAKQKTNINNLGKNCPKGIISMQKRATNNKINVPALDLNNILSKKTGKNKLVIPNIQNKENSLTKIKQMPKQKSRNLMKSNKVLNISSSPNNDYFNTSVSKNDKTFLDNDRLINKNKYSIIQKKSKIKNGNFLTVNDNIINKNKTLNKNKSNYKNILTNNHDDINDVKMRTENKNNDNKNIINNTLNSISSKDIFNNKIKTSTKKAIKLNKPKKEISKLKMKILLDNNNENKPQTRKCETERESTTSNNSNIVSIINRKNKKLALKPLRSKKKTKKKCIIFKNNYNYNNISTNINTTNNINIKSLKIINDHYKNKPKNIINNFISESNKNSIKSSFISNELSKSNSLRVIKLKKNNSTRNINLKNRKKNNIINGRIYTENDNNENYFMKNKFLSLIKNNTKSVSHDDKKQSKYKRFCYKRENEKIMNKRVKNFKKTTNLPLKYFNRSKKNINSSNDKNKKNNSKNKTSKKNSVTKRIFSKKMGYENAFCKKFIDLTLLNISTTKNFMRSSNHTSGNIKNNTKLVKEKKTSGNNRKNHLKTFHKFLLFAPVEINITKSNEKIQKKNYINKKLNRSYIKNNLKLKDEKEINDFNYRKNFSVDNLIVSVNDNIKKNIKLTKENNNLNKNILSLQEKILNKLNNAKNIKHNNSKYENKTPKKEKKEIDKQNPKPINDPQQEKEYLNEILFNLFKEEKEAKNKNYIDPYYLITKKREVTPEMRTMIIDWMFEVHQLFNFSEKSLFMTVQLMDRFLSKEKIKPNELQLLISTCINISSKHEELEYPILDNFITVSGYNFTADDMINMEYRVLQAINWEILCPNAYDFFQIFSNICELNPIENCQGIYILNIILMDVNMLQFSVSLLAFVVTKIVTKKNLKIIIDFFKEIKNDICKIDQKKKEDIDEKTNDIKLIDSIISNFNDTKTIEDIEQKIRILFRAVQKTQYYNAKNKFNARKFHAVSTYTVL